MVRISSIVDDKTKKDFDFTEHQLGVIDTKANNVLMVDSVLIVISTLGIIFKQDVTIELKAVMTAATICVLASVGLCIRTIWITWANEVKVKQDSDLISTIEKLRELKKRFLHASLIVLIMSLVLFVVSFIMDLATKSTIT